MKNKITNFFNHAANAPQNTGGGNSHFYLRLCKSTALLLLTLTLGVGNAWGAISSSASTTLVLSSSVSTGLSKSYNFNSDATNSDTLLFSLYDLYNSSATYAYSTSGIGNSSYSSTPKLYNDITGKSETSYTKIYSEGKQSNIQKKGGKDLTILVSNCTAVVFTSKCNGNSNSPTVSAYLYTSGSEAEEASVTQNNTSTSMTTKTLSGLSASNTYAIKFTNGTDNSTTNQYFYEVAFVYPHAAAGPSISSFSPATGASVGASQEITITSSTGSTVYYLWATSEPASAAAVVSADHHGTAGAASATTTVESGKTLYAVAVKDATNSTVASATYTIDATAPTLSSSTPANSATNVATSGNIVLTFSENVTVNDASKFTLSGGTGSLTTASISVSGTAVTIPYTGLANSTTYTLATAAGAVKDAVNNTSAALSNISFTTAAASLNSTATWPMVATNAVSLVGSANNSAITPSNAVASFTDNLNWNGVVTSSYTDYTGKMAKITENNTANITDDNSSVNEDVYVKYSITVASGYTFTPTSFSVKLGRVGTDNGAAKVELKKGSTSIEATSISKPARDASSVASSTYTKEIDGASAYEAGDVLDLYVYLGGKMKNKSFLISDVSITGTYEEAAPAETYAVTYSSAKGTAPSNTTASEVTLAEITGVSGWKNTGWKANVATTVGGESVAANTLIANGSTVTLTAATTFTAQWAEYHAITENTPANGTVETDVETAIAGTTISITATPSSGYIFSAWDVYKTGESATKVSVTNNQFTMPDYAVTVSATFVHIPTVDDLVVIDADYTFEPTSSLVANTLYEEGRFISLGDGNPYTSGKGIRIKENRALAFKVANNAKVKVTFVKDGSIQMQLGTATSGEERLAYGYSTTSPKEFDVITTGGVVYLTASNQLDMSKLEILYPHTVTYALNGGTGTLPTEGAHYKGEQFNVHNGTTGITAPENKEFSVWSDGTSTYAGGAQYTMGSANVTLTAQWITALPLPTITFNNGAYTIGGSALNLSTLFSSNSDGAVTYSVKTAGETGATITGTSFTASAAGSATVTASQAATASYKAKSVDATITISAPTEPEGVKLVVDNALTGNFRCGKSLSDGSCTVGGISYSKYVTMGSTYTSWGPDAGPSNKYFSYTVQKKSTRFYFYLNNTGSAAKIHLYTSAEGSAAAATKNDIDVAAGTSVVTYDLATTTNTEVFIGVSSTNIRFCQIVAVESGDSHLLAPAVGYAMSLNKGRLSTASGTATTLDGVTFVVSSGYKPAYSTTAQIGTKETHYVSFTIPTGQTRQLQLTTSSTTKYTVSKTLGDDENQFTPTANTAKNWNLTEGTWYINPQGSNVNITNIAFAAAPDAWTVTFKDGSTTLGTQSVWNGETATALSPAPTKSGYRFVKWQLSGADYNFSTAVTANIQLDAVWQKTWTVTFNADNGSDPTEVTVDNNTAVAAPATDPEKAGNEFAGWYYGDPAAVYNFATLVTADLTLTAHWTPLDDDASISALSYDGSDIDLAEGEEIAGVMTFNVLLPWGETPDKDLISVTKSAESATVGTISYDSESKTASFTVTAGDHTTTADYAIVFANDVKKGASIIKATIAGGDQQAGFAATGLYGDKGYANTRDNKKLDTGGKFVGVKLISGKTFATGDKLFVVTSTDANMGYIEIYEEAEGTNLIKATGVRDASEGIEVPELAGYSEFYIVRKASTGDQAWNGFVDYVEVTREMNPAIKSFKFGDDAATINEAAKTISIDVPYGTDVTALTPTVEAYGNNGATYTPNGETDFTSPVDYVVTDAYGELSTTYEVTINVAAASTNADLASLSVEGYALDFDPATTTYNIVLNYGTTVLPAITYEVADLVSPATAVKVEGGVNGATTITVTAQSGAEKVYTINFSVSLNPVFVIYDGSTMTNIASRTGSDVATGFSYSMASNVAIAGESVAGSWGGKNYSKVIKGFKPNDNTSNIVSFVIPENYLAKVCLVGATNSDDDERKMFIANVASRNASDAIGDYIITSSTYDAQGFVTDFLQAGTYYLGSTDSYRLYEFSVTLYRIDHSRDVTQGRYGTICLPNGGLMVGAAIFEMAHKTYKNDQPYKVFFDEVINGVMEAGMPYIFMPKEGVTSIAVTYTDNANASAGNYKGLYGTLDYINGEALYGKYIFSNNSIFMSENPQNWLNANRAYIVLDEVPSNESAPAPGRRRVAMGFNGNQVPEVATGLDEISQEPIANSQKLLINGQIFILRGEKMYDVTGKLVK